MASFKIIEANGKSVCRGGEKSCIGKIKLHDYKKIIPKGSKALEISVYGAGGGATAYYCEVCMHAEFDSMKKVLDQAAILGNNQI